MLPDTGERYMTTPLFDGIEAEMDAEEIGAVALDARLPVPARDPIMGRPAWTRRQMYADRPRPREETLDPADWAEVAGPVATGSSTMRSPICATFATGRCGGRCLRM